MRADLYKELFEEESRHFWHIAKRELVLSTVAQATAGRERVRVLELGCGAGKLLEELRRRDLDAWGSDAAPEALRWCRERGLDHVFLHDARDALPPATGLFDVVLALDLLEHLDDDLGALRSWRESLKPGGLLVLHVPAHPGLFGYWDQMLGHRRRYRSQDLAETLTRAGYTVERLTPTFAWLVGPAALFRKVLRRRSDPGTARSDFQFSPRLVAWAGKFLGWVESRWLRIADLPCGLSLLALARKPEGPEVGP